MTLASKPLPLGRGEERAGGRERGEGTFAENPRKKDG